MTDQTDPMNPPLLLVEDMPSLQMVYKAVLQKAGFQVECAGTAEEGLRLFRRINPRVVLLDLMLPDLCGLKLMDQLLTINQDARVIVITANGSINKAVEAMRAGAFEFLVKPFDEARLIGVIENAEIEVRPTAQALPEVEGVSRYHGFIGSSPKMREVYNKINSISGSMATVFISGESGTGKEVCAQAVHDTSMRARGPFVPLIVVQSPRICWNPRCSGI
jgi:two component, sigma54 specific, transcriptional regulator, Fis family